MIGDDAVASLKASAGGQLTVRSSDRARRMSLRVDARSGAIVLTLPRGTDPATANAFVWAQRRWIHRHNSAMPDRIPFAPGAIVPVFGQPHVICHIDAGGPPVTRTEGQLIVTGDRRHLARRVGDHLRKTASIELRGLVSDLASRIGRRVSRITIRDPKSRWGSCSANGSLSFSWRLVMAPPPVLTYVAAHEVAHLRHPNHGARFWALVAELHPTFEEDRQTLKRLAFDLNRYGESEA